MKIPDWYELVLLGIASWRTFNLLAYDKILEGPRRWLTRLPYDWDATKELPEEYKMKWALFINCPYCAGFWVGVVWFAAWEITPFWTTVATIPFVFNAIVVALAKILTPEE